MQSGYLITAALLREEANNGAIRLGAFYTRRAARLFPAYFAVLALYAFLFLVIGVEPERRAAFVAAMPYYLTYTQEIPFYRLHGNMPFFQTWTLGLEEKFYLLWPLFAFGAPRSFGTRLSFAIAIFVGASLFRANEGWGRYIGAITPIAGGCILALIMDAPERRERLKSWAKRWSGFIGVTWIGWHLVSYFGSPSLEFAMHYVYPLVVAGVLLACLTDTPLARCMSIAPLRFLGEISYGFFLLHVLVRNVVANLLFRVGVLDAPISVFLCTALVTSAGAWVLYRVVEAPAYEWGRRFAVRSPVAVSAPASEA
jgi:peptidoglycan/LPS O-acetylase OafA/YrhL